MPNRAIPPEEPPKLSTTVAAEARMILQLLLTLQEVVTVVDLKTEVQIEADLEAREAKVDTTEMVKETLQ